MRLVIGLVFTAVGLAVAGWRLSWLARRVLTGGSPAERLGDARVSAVKGVRGVLSEVFGQRRLVRWRWPGWAHAATFWGFVVLLATIAETYGDLVDPRFGLGHWAGLGFLEDVFSVAVLASLVVFTVIRYRHTPRRMGRWSRFYRSHTGTAWAILAMIFAVVATLLVYRGAQMNTGHFPYRPYRWSFASWLVARALPAGQVNEALETIFVLAQIAVIMGFAVLLAFSKHLHIVAAPVNVFFARSPDGLGPLMPVVSGDHVVDFADPRDDDRFGLGTVDDLTWKGRLDLLSCTECGRCQSQCPAWNTEKPLNPKLIITDLRDALLAKRADGEPRPLVGSGGPGVIDPEALWACTNCGACVHECPVDIEHLDHITGMRRHQVLVESNFPAEATTMLRNLEERGNPWGMPSAARLAWTDGLPVEVRVATPSRPLDDVDYLWWVGCAGAFDDRAKRATRALAELLTRAGVRFAVLGTTETCSGDPARRLGNEFLFQTLARHNIETLDAVAPPSILTGCPHCFNTLAREYPQLGGRYRVVHHSQLLAELLASGRLNPARPLGDRVTYHDPCFLGRHNKIYRQPRHLLDLLGDCRVEMPRHGERSFCCGAGGARMWLEERVGRRINHTRIDEALALQPDVVATACPYCTIMLGDAVRDRSADGVAVRDIAELLRSALDPQGNGKGAADA
ncbi:MAG: 4Fe-4S dicluster domain-containing protein [Acidothermus sp.]|nr:4Fe-4S dicluster domain-containing protein [Acidothermus sp.]MCL6537410.1 (Fe-S)-binding protein [Acidothermus sp.]